MTLFKRGGFPNSLRIFARIMFWALVVSTGAFAQSSSPWASAAQKMGGDFSGPIAKGFALVAIVVGGLELAFGEGSGRRTVGGIVFGLGLALAANSFIAWLFP